MCPVELFQFLCRSLLCRLQPRGLYLAFHVIIHCLADRQECVLQIPVALPSGFGDDSSGFRADESFGFKAADVFGHGVFGHAHCFADRFVAGPALLCLSVCAAEQEGVDRQLAGT